MTSMTTVASNWRALTAAQQPPWPDRAALDEVLGTLRALPTPVRAADCAGLLERMAAVSRGEAFLLQGGACAETFSTSARVVRSTARTVTEMGALIRDGAGIDVVTVGRIAGQYAKPRSLPVEERDGTVLPVYRGDAVNGREFTARDRTPDPARLRRARDIAAGTAAMLADEVPGLWTSHEALLLDYEDALVRDGYALSGHLLWIGERTRRPEGAHIEFMSRVANPVGVKLGPSTTPREAVELAGRLDPHRTPGRLTFITRMGAGRIGEVLPGIVERVTAEGFPVAWVCDPMHGNTVVAPSGHKTRHLTTVLDEVTGFFEVHRSLGTHPGGVHLELTGEGVTECTGGSDPVTEADLPRRYESACDPRLNRSQSLDAALRVAELLRTRLPAQRPACSVR